MSADYSGCLQKGSGSFIPQDQTRYFELRGCMLYYWKSKSQRTSKDPIGCIDLTDASVVDDEVSKVKGKGSGGTGDSNLFCWSVTGPKMDKVHTFIAQSESDKEMWMEKMANPNLQNTQILKTTGEESDEEETKTVFSSEQRFKMSRNDFELLAVIGKGSFGKVFQVRKKDTGKVYAMKEMRKDIIERENVTENIFAERSILQNISHPFIVTLHYAFQTKDKLYLVLDLLSGGELFFHLGKVGTFDEYRAKFYCGEIGLALGYLHSLNIIYRDLKPENAVLDGDGHVCLTDFGLAKMNVCDATASTFCGTPEYLAPEFLLGQPHGKAVDWWSLGILLYEMLQGIPPFYSENVNEMYDLILGSELEFQEELPISPEAQDLLRRLLDRDADKRLQNVDEFKQHPFFNDIDWEKLYNRELSAPFKPESDALSNFDAEFTSQQPRLSIRDPDSSCTSLNPNLTGFTFDGDAVPPTRRRISINAQSSKRGSNLSNVASSSMTAPPTNSNANPPPSKRSDSGAKETAGKGASRKSIEQTAESKPATGARKARTVTKTGDKKGGTSSAQSKAT